MNPTLRTHLPVRHMIFEPIDITFGPKSHRVCLCANAPYFGLRFLPLMRDS